MYSYREWRTMTKLLASTGVYVCMCAFQFMCACVCVCACVNITNSIMYVSRTLSYKVEKSRITLISNITNSII